jgi:pyrroloquinoline quinone biosynthesis protein D
MSDSASSAISEDAVVELFKQYRFQWESAQDCFVLLYPEGMVQLPGSAGEIMKRVDGKNSVSQIIADLETTFPGADLRQDVINFLEAAHAKGWIRQQDSE